MRWRLIFLISGLLLVLAAFGIVATAQDDICPILVQDALEQMGDNCGGLGRNSACYGFTRVDSTFMTEQTEGFFSAPADQAALAQLETISTRPLDLDLDQWGIAVMSVQANVPNALPGQAVVFMLMGETDVTNEVNPDTAVDAVEPTSVQLQSDTRIFSGPDRATNVLTTIDSGSQLMVDGVSADGNWLRVLTDSGIGWMRREAIDSGAALTGLPAIDGTEQTPMQAFQVRTAFNDLSCTEAPSLLAVQSPEGIKVDIMANGVHIRMGSLIILSTVSPGDTIQIITVFGDVVLDPESADSLQLLPNFSTTHCLGDDGNIGDDCEWTEPLPLTPEQLIWVQTVLAAYEELGDVGGNTGPVVIDGTPVQIIETDSCANGTTIQHTVQSGDTLFALGLRYNTTVLAIAARNGLTNSIIIVGQQLTIVCGERGPASLPGFEDPPPTEEPELTEEPPVVEPPPRFDCTGFAATSPLDGLPYGVGTFFWDLPASVPDFFQVNISGESGTSSFVTGSGTQSNLSADLTIGSIGFGFSFSWNVQAIVDGEVVCTSSAGTMFREAPPPGPDDGGGQDPPPEATEEPCRECCVECGLTAGSSRAQLNRVD